MLMQFQNRMFSTSQQVNNENTINSSNEHEKIFSNLTFKPYDSPSISTPPKCSYPAFEDKGPEPVRFNDKITNLHYSSKRMNMCCIEIRGKHIGQAIEIAETMDKRGGEWLLTLLKKLKETGTEKGLNPDFFYVSEAYVGKSYRGKKIDIKARGKNGVIRPPKTSVTIILEEKPLENVIKDALTGNSPPHIGKIMRHRLYEKNADFDEVRKYSFMLTAKGRYYRRQQFHRLVLLAQKDYQRRGVHLKTKQIMKYMLEKQMRLIVNQREEIQTKLERQSIVDRKKHFEQFYEKKK